MTTISQAVGEVNLPPRYGGKHDVKTLDIPHDKRGIDFVILLITDVTGCTSRLIGSSSAPLILDDLPYPPLPDGMRDAVGMVSRAKKTIIACSVGLLEK